MKISKLFHWLYACVMLAPVFAVVGGVAYTIFNKNAKDSYSGTKVQEVEVVNYNFNELNTNGNYYVQTTLYNNTPANNVIGVMYVDKVTLENSNTDLSNVKQFRFVNYTSGITTLQLRDNDSNTISTLTLSSNVYKLNFDYISTTDISIFNLSCFNYYRLSYNNYYYVDNAFYYGMENMASNDLFKWAGNSFLSQPITYVTGLFNMPNDSPFILLMSYWLNISIIWLTFDLIMYVPLLVHRWLDKGVLE